MIGPGISFVGIHNQCQLHIQPLYFPGYFAFAIVDEPIVYYHTNNGYQENRYQINIYMIAVYKHKLSVSMVVNTRKDS